MHMSLSISEALGPISLGGGAVPQVPPDDEMIAVVQQGTPPLPPPHPLDFADSGFELQRVGGNDVPLPNVHTP